MVVVAVLVVLRGRRYDIREINELPENLAALRCKELFQQHSSLHR